MGTSRPNFCACTNASRLITGTNPGGLSHRGLKYKYCHPTHAVLPIGCGILAEMGEKHRHWYDNFTDASVLIESTWHMDNLSAYLLGIGHSPWFICKLYVSLNAGIFLTFLKSIPRQSRPRVPRRGAGVYKRGVYEIPITPPMKLRGLVGRKKHLFMGPYAASDQHSEGSNLSPQ